MILKPGLYIVSTPIGNMDDITIRALNILQNSDLILCEDTRISRKLLAKHKIQKNLQVYNDHSDRTQREIISRLIDQGKVVSLISDAGTPLISDPGYKLVKELQHMNYHIDIAPGVSSPIAALTLSGLPSDRFFFGGFLPKTTESKKKVFSDFAKISATMIFFDTALRLISSLKIAQEIFGNREICVARELTKMYQQIKAGPISEVIDFYQSNPLKGEIVLLISGNPEEKNLETINNDLNKFIEEHFTQGLSAKSITDLAYENFSKFYSKNEIYKIANQLKNTLLFN